MGRPAPRLDVDVEHDRAGEDTLDPAMFTAPPAPLEAEVEAPAVTQ